MTKANKLKAIFTVNGVSLKSTGATVSDVLNSFGLSYRDIKTKGEITIINETKTASRLIQLPKLRRYFASKLLMTSLIRDFERLLK